VRKDKKQVGFLHTHLVRPGDGGFTRRGIKNKRRRLVIKCPPVRRDYAQFMSGVDRNDRESADYSTSIRTNRWYLRIFFWVLDRVIFSCYIIAVYLASSGLKPTWNKYRSKLSGRFEFQVDLAMALIDFGIRLDWKAPYDEADKPKWMRQKKYVPCSCGVCFFCVEDKTTGIISPPPRGVPKVNLCSTESDIPKELEKL
jgi:hypothetical protein